MECPFCKLKNYLVAGNLAFVVEDKHPVSPGHLLIIPKAHRLDYFALSAEELSEMNSLIKTCRDQILARDKTVQGFNIGVNCGAVAGQTVFHCHIHLIPRRPGDDANPRGGVRAVIDGKKSY